MLLVGYLYGVKSERRLVQEVQLNIAYRWFCGFVLTDKSNRCYYMNAPCSWQPVTGEGHLIAQVV